MRLDWEIAKRGWRRYAVYPWATAAGMFTNTIFGFLQAYILLADLPAPDRRRRLRRAGRGHVRLARAGDDHDRLHLQLVGARLADPRRLDRDRPLAPARSAALLARVRPRPCAVPPDLPRRPAVRGRRGWSSSLHYPSPLDAARVRRQPHARRRRQLRLSLPLQLRRVLAARLPRRRHALDHDRRLLLRDGDPRAVLPGLAARPSPTRCRSRRSSRRRSTSGSASATGAELARVLGLQVFWAAALLGTRPARAARAARGGWWCRVVETRPPLAAPRRRAGPLAAAVPRLVRARPVRRVPDLVRRLPGGARDLPQRLARSATWNVHEVAFLYALSSISFAFTDLLIGHLDQFPQKIRDGNFDILLVRPRGTLFQVVASDFALRRLGKAIQGAVVLVYALDGLHVHWTVGRVRVLARDDPERRS